MAAKKKPAIPNVPVSDKATQHFLSQVKETLEVGSGQRGDILDRFVTVRELIDSGVVRKLTYSDIYGSDNYYDFAPVYTDDDDLTPPPAPTNLTASGAFTSITLQWDKPTHANHEKTYIYRLGTDVIGSSISIASTTANIFTDEVGYNKTYFYWIQFESKAGIKGPYNQTAGTSGTTLADIGAVMVQLSEDITGLNGYSTLITTTIPTLISNAGTASTQIIRATSAPSVRADGTALQLVDIWVDTTAGNDNQMYVRNAANNAWVKARDSSLVDLVGLQSGTGAFTGSSLSVAMATAQTDHSTLATSVTNLSSTVNTTHAGYFSTINTEIWGSNTQAGTSRLDSLVTTVGDANSGLVQSVNTNASNQTATATSLTNLTAKVGGGNDADGTAYSSSNTIAQHVTATENNSQSSLVLQTDANGSVAQMILHSNASAGSSPTSVITFRADSFAVSNNSSTGVFPFIVDDGVTYMDTARIKDGAIQNAKLGIVSADKITTGGMNAARITAGTMDFDRIDGNSITVTEAMIGTAVITNTKLANASIDTAKVGSLYANSLSGDVSKAVAGSLASTVSYQNRSDTYSSAIVELQLPKATHTSGWSPYASYNINKVNTEKNSWMYVSLEMAAWNVNSQGGTSNETAATSSVTSAYGSGFDGSAIVSNFLIGVSGYQTSGTEALNFTPSHVEGVVANMIVTDGTNERTVTGNTTILGVAVVGYSGSNVAAWNSTTNFTFKESVSSGSTGVYKQVAQISWIAVDTAYNDFAISGTYNSDGSPITHGIKSRVRMKGQSSGVDQGTLTINITDATAFLMGVR